MKKQKLAQLRNNIKFRLKGTLPLFIKYSKNDNHLTDWEKTRFAEIRSLIDELFKSWDHESFKLGITPKPLYIVYNRNKQEIECKIKENSTDYKVLDHYLSDKILYSVIKLETEQDFKNYLVREDLIFPEVLKRKQKEFKKFVDGLNKDDSPVIIE